MTKIIQNRQVILEILEIENSSNLIGREHAWAHLWKNDDLDGFFIWYFITMTKFIQNGYAVHEILEIEKLSDLIGREHA